MAWLALHHASGQEVSQPLAAPKRLTSNPTENPISVSAISPDGKYLAYSDRTGTYLRLMSTGEVHSLLPKDRDVQYLSWYPDGTRLLVSWPPSPAAKMGLWELSIVGGNPRQLSDEGWSASISPDGSQIIFLKTAAYGETGHELWLMRADGADQHKVLLPPMAPFFPRPCGPLTDVGSPMRNFVMAPTPMKHGLNFLIWSVAPDVSSLSLS